jgi:7-cyano-7-deazaguanine reductase
LKSDIEPQDGSTNPLEVFENPSPSRDFVIRIRVPEFTCLCPKTGQPDFAELLLEYIADQHCVELKSLKQYVWGYRQVGAFHEAVSNKILDDLVTLMNPRFARLTADFNVRGGIYTQVVAEYRDPRWEPPTPIMLASPASGSDSS